MTVSQLIELLKTCDQGARVVVSMEAVDQDFLFTGATEDVDRVASGYVDDLIVSDLTFRSSRGEWQTAPAVRILGINHST